MGVLLCRMGLDERKEARGYKYMEFIGKEIDNGLLGYIM